ncbi:VWA domain-containing protein [Rhodoferax lacus]|uniref:VWA domain-containing protein n=1 Tax=Rhodoferax lacus TaxID=2184758 RepID=A0A3E1R5S7_9BURK|nr:VWA domain-containing protein [Rhodoferax lacus]
MNAMRQAEVVCGGGQQPMLLGVQAQGAVKGRLLAMRLQQRFRNASDTNTEISYTFPLPFGAVLMGVDVELNGKALFGEVTAKNTARARYEEALSGGNSGILLEHNADHSYTLELGNLMAREACSITVRYAQVLQLEQGQIRLMLPTTIAPRYGNPITQGRLQPHQVAVSDLSAEYPFDISITLHGDLAKASVASPSHKAAYLPQGDALVVQLAQRGCLDRDFILTLSDLQSQSVALACPDACVPGQTAVMASFSPQLEGSTAQAVAAKILVDCSGSMAGDSIGAARKALHRIVATLQAADRFSLSRFGGTVEHRSRGLWGGTAQAKASATRWIDALDANLGGTEMEAALVSTIAIAHQGKSDILLVTDGEIHGIEDVIVVATQSGHRVFLVAIGASPAEAHLRRLAMATGGACDFVAPGEDVEPAVLRMFSRLRFSRASQLRLEWPAGTAVHWAQPVPAQAFADDALTVCAFVDAAPLQQAGQVLRLWGRLDGADTEVLLAQAAVALVESSANTLARVVASAQVAQATHDADDLFEGPAQVQALAVQYQLVTEHTNFILVHERAEADKALDMPLAHQVPQMLAAGWGGTGSVTFSMKRASVSLSLQVDDIGFGVQHGSMAAPSVWRTTRSAASARVDALSSGGMDDYDIPAFLRKQADDGPQYRYRSAPDDAGISPAELSDWLQAHAQTQWPKTYAALRQLGLGLATCEWLELEIGNGQNEADVVVAFLAAVLACGLTAGQGIGRAVLAIKTAMRPAKQPVVDARLMALVRSRLQGLQALQWPEAVRNFPLMLEA